MSTFSDYAVGGAAGGTSASDDKPTQGYKDLGRLKRDFLDYLGSKREEIDEQQDADRFVNGSHWTSQQVAELNKRKQPVVWENVVKRKIDGIVGTLARLKQDPKAYPRTPKHEEGAELATAVLRYVTDEQHWDAKDAHCARVCAFNGISGVEVNVIEGDRGDRDIEIASIVKDGFFYDPRSYESDFSDARYMGVAKWLELDAAVEMFPDKQTELENSVDAGMELSTDSDREQKWFRGSGDVKQIRVVDHWYKLNGDWLYAIYTGSTKLKEGKSYLSDEKGKTFCKYIMFSCYIDQDGDRYGFIRDLKPLNQELNMRKSKALYLSLSRRMIAENGAFDDVEVARREAARSDGVVIHNKGYDAQFDDAARQMETETQFKFAELTRAALESFGPNIAVLGQGLENSSGRAIHLLQQAGLADLGPYIQSYRSWKIRLYRAIWNAVQQHWTAERWIRVTDDDDLSQFVQVNGLKNINPMTGQEDPIHGIPTIVNKLGSLDVDIILDEGPDEVNLQGDAYDTLTLLVSKSAGIPPELVKPYLEMLIELSPLPLSMKKRALDKFNPQPDPQAQQEAMAKKQLEFRGAAAEVAGKEADAGLKQAQAAKTAREAAVVQPDQGQAPEMPEHPAVTAANIQEKQASAMLKHNQAMKLALDARMMPFKLQQEADLAREALNAKLNRQAG